MILIKHLRVDRELKTVNKYEPCVRGMTDTKNEDWNIVILTD